MSTSLSWLLPLLALALLAGCQAADESRPATVAAITGRTWTLVSLDKQTVTIPAERRTPSLELHAEPPRMAAYGGVNRLSGTYTTDGAALTIAGLISTRMAGPEEAMATEAAFIRVLNGVQSWSLVDGQLELTGSGGTARLAPPSP